MGYFSSDSRILMANGLYKNITDVKRGDIVLNMNMEGVKVLKVVKIEGLQMNEMYYHNWYCPFYFTKDLQFLILQKSGDNSFDEIIWKSDIEQNDLLTCNKDIYDTIVPNTFTYSIKLKNSTLEIVPSYELGLLIGLYAGYGNIDIVDGKKRVEFIFGLNEALPQKVADLLNQFFNIKPVIQRYEYHYSINSDNKNVVKFFKDFGDRFRRIIPQKYMANDFEYVKGLYNGLVDYNPTDNVSCYIAINKEMAEIFLWIVSSLGLSFENKTNPINNRELDAYPLFVKHDLDEIAIGKISSINTNTQLLMTGYNLITNCGTNSIIVNNIVVQTMSNINGIESSTSSSSDSSSDTDSS